MSCPVVRDCTVVDVPQLLSMSTGLQRSSDEATVIVWPALRSRPWREGWETFVVLYHGDNVISLRSHMKRYFCLQLTCDVPTLLVGLLASIRRGRGRAGRA